MNKNGRKKKTEYVYAITEAGLRYFDFLGDPVRFSPDEQRVNEERRQCMTRADWQREQILVNLDALRPAGMTRVALVRLFRYQHSSCYEAIDRILKEKRIDSEETAARWKKTADDAKWAAENMDDLLRSLFDHGLIKILP